MKKIELLEKSEKAEILFEEMILKYREIGLDSKILEDLMAFIKLVANNYEMAEDWLNNQELQKAVFNPPTEQEIALGMSSEEIRWGLIHILKDGLGKPLSVSSLEPEDDNESKMTVLIIIYLYSWPYLQSTRHTN